MEKYSREWDKIARDSRGNDIVVDLHQQKFDLKLLKDNCSNFADS